ncbi:hypothetical protein EIK77_007109 [Talaromyces pinophilus]|nr:hypothetical protein EIK77_007109 [Talaromyces pinophilus]
MLDINDFVADRGGDLNKIRESQRRRYAPESVVEEVLELFEAARRARYEVTQIGSKINAVQKEIGQKKKNKEDASELLQQKIDLDKQKKEAEENALAKEKERDSRIKTIGNYVHDSVPISDNEDDNVVERTWAPENVVVEKRDCLSHHEVLTRLDGYDPERGVKVVGHRGYCLTGYGLFLNLALVNYGLEFLFNKGYKPNAPPHFMLKDAMAKTAQLEQFDEELYKVSESEDKDTDKYLIATSEQPLSALHSEEWFQEADLPVKYAGYSTCYRKEAGSHGKDAWGIFRVHQFEKVITPYSWEAFDEMIATSEEFYKSLGLPYQVVSIVSGALNNAAAKKYDLEAWFPFQGEYKELVSCSNCTDYQTRELEIRFGAKKADSKKTYVHALNATLCATERTLCCILENYQTEDVSNTLPVTDTESSAELTLIQQGFNVPEPLRKYIPGAPAFLPFTRELPKDTTSAKKGKGGVAGAAKQLNDLKV